MPEFVWGCNIEINGCYLSHPIYGIYVIAAQTKTVGVKFLGSKYNCETFISSQNKSHY